MHKQIRENLINSAYVVTYVVLDVFLLDNVLDDKIDDGKCHESEYRPHDIVVILLNLGIQLVFGHDGGEIPAQGGEDSVPSTSTDGGVEQELPIGHTCQSRGDADQMAYAWDESSGECSYHAVIVEVLLALLHLLLVEQTHLAPFDVGKLIDDGSAHLERQEIVDGCAEVGTDGGKQHHEPYVQLAAMCMKGGRRHYQFRWYGYHGTLQQHKQQDGAIVQVS